MAKRRPRGAGAVRQLPSGRWQARFRGPDGVMRPAPDTFDTKLDADRWLARQNDDVERGLWEVPEERARRGQTFAQYAATWMQDRELRPLTRKHYEDLLTLHILPFLGERQLDRISPGTIRSWYGQDLPQDKPTTKSHAYSLVRAIYRTAITDDLVPAPGPCRIAGAGRAKPAKEAKPATLAELEVIVANLQEKYHLLVLLAAWCGLRWGELTELRRGDVELEDGLLRVRRGVTRARGVWHIGDPKSNAGKRAVAIPPHLLPLVEKHLATIGPEQDAPLWANQEGGPLSPSTLQPQWHRARAAAGRPDLRFHDLRHTGATLTAAAGATIKELMVRLGHTTPDAAMRYQHAALERDRAIAEALSGFASAKVVALQPVRQRGGGRRRRA